MISVVIPTYKNIQLFLKNLNNNLRFLTTCEIIIVNDDPYKPLKTLTDSRFRGNDYKIILIENKKNLGFGSSVNIGVKQAKNPYVMLLNDDVMLKNSSFKKALNHFSKDNFLFAVSFAQKEKDGKIVGKNRLFWQRGLIFHSSVNDLKLGSNGWAEGGTCMIDKKKFLELGGFDSLYSPFYWEDTDLSYRAWKRGYRILFDPEIILSHQHESTIGKYFSESKIKTIAFRNQFIFIWKNIHDLILIFQHFIYLPFNCIYFLIKGESSFFKGLLCALVKVNEIRKKRSSEQKQVKLTDQSVRSIFNHA